MTFDHYVILGCHVVFAAMLEKACASFPAPTSVGYREWGEELLLVLAKGLYSMKLIKITAGHQGGLQYHRIKDEAGYILSGHLTIRYEKNGEILNKNLKQGDWFHFPAGSIHQEIAITDVEILEVSTPHFNDRVRVEHIFGNKEDEAIGLPSTNVTDIEYR